MALWMTDVPLTDGGLWRQDFIGDKSAEQQQERYLQISPTVTVYGWTPPLERETPPTAIGAPFGGCTRAVLGSKWGFARMMLLLTLLLHVCLFSRVFRKQRRPSTEAKIPRGIGPFRRGSRPWETPTRRFRRRPRPERGTEARLLPGMLRQTRSSAHRTRRSPPRRTVRPRLPAGRERGGPGGCGLWAITLPCIYAFPCPTGRQK